MHSNFATDLLMTYFMCAGCVTLQVIAQHHKQWRLVLPVAGPPIFFFFGREIHTGLAWQRLIGPVCASVSIASICSILAKVGQREDQIVPSATTASLAVDMVHVHPAPTPAPTAVHVASGEGHVYV